VVGHTSEGNIDVRYTSEEGIAFTLKVVTLQKKL